MRTFEPATRSPHRSHLAPLAADAFGAAAVVRPDGTVEVDGLVLLHDDASEPGWILRPECDRCGSVRGDDFAYEPWTLAGVEVWGQTSGTCRSCRFLSLPATPVRVAATGTSGWWGAASPPR